MVGELKDGEVAYRTMTSCLMPLANAAGKHVVTVEGINPQDDSLTPVQQAMVDESGTQCGFCTVGFAVCRWDHQPAAIAAAAMTRTMMPIASIDR